MNKPPRPKKPHKNDKKPSKDREISKWICVDSGQQLFLRPVELDEYGYRKEYHKGDLFTETFINFYDLERIAKSLDHGFSISCDTGYDGYLDGWVVSWTEDNPDYDKEINDYDKRFDRHAYKMKKYEEEMTLYNIWKKEQEIEQLKLKIKKKEKEIRK